ncbi:MAG: hypothetical protein CMH54_05285 [Myxococcales bacterium]|nr:hypothetical protein [Myxococcales bacterium]
MFRFLIYTFALCTALIPFPASANTGGALVDQIQAFYDRTPTLDADFEQKTVRARLNRTKLRSGRVRVLRPNRIRWDYTAPTPVHYVADGQHLWVYQPADALAYRMNIKDSKLDEAVRFLAGSAPITQQFNVRNIDAQKGYEQWSFVELTPKGESTTIHRLLLGVDPKTGRVHVSILEDPDGNSVYTKYSNFRSAPPAAKAFVFTAPKGVRVEQLGPNQP